MYQGFSVSLRYRVLLYHDSIYFKELKLLFEKKLFFSVVFIVLVQFPIWDYLSCILGEKKEPATPFLDLSYKTR